jgi:LysR family hydrogen peroxide-inducible transcriptional activator
MNRSQIEYILAVAKWRSFGKAADACFVTQSTLSAMVAKVEQQIGIQIFNRTTRPVSITPDGEEVLIQLRSLNREYQLLDERINELQGIETGELNIACIPTVAPYLYPLILDKLSNQFNQVDITVHELTTETIVEEIIAGNVDIGIVSIPLENNQLVEYELYQEDFLLFDCGQNKKNKSYKVTEIDLERLWLLEEGHCLRNQVGKICELRQQKKINGNLTYNCGSIFTLIEMVKKNKGVTLLPRLAIAKNKQLNKTTLFELEEPVPLRQIGSITHKHFIKKRLLRQLNNIIIHSVNKYIPTLQQEENIINPF